MTNKNKILLIGLIIIVLVGGLLILSNKQNVVVDIDESEKNSGTSEKIDTSVWKTYESTEYGFKFKYPANLNISSAEEGEDELPKGSVIINMPTKYPFVDKLDLGNPNTYVNYKLVIIPRGNGTNNESIEKIQSDFSALAEEQLKIVRVNGDTTVISDDEGRYFYFVGKNNIYNLNTEGLIPMPKKGDNEDWSLGYSESELKEWSKLYLNYTNVISGVAETFEFFE
jgi:hypothetical protein